MHCVWIMTCFFFGFSLQMDLVLAGGLSECSVFQYKLNRDPTCKDCPACPAGEMYTQNCGYMEINGVITKPRKGCKECPPNHYKTRGSPYECAACTYNCPKGREIAYPCNKTHDLKCAKCKKGFFTASDGSCVRCSPCCGKPSIYGKQYTEKECEDAGMQGCSCRPLQNCVDKSGACKKALLKVLTTKRPPIISESMSKNTNATTIQPPLSSTSPDGKLPTLQPQIDESKGQEKEQSFVTGWLVAIVIGIVLVATILFIMSKHFNILKKIKVLLKPHQEDVANSKPYMDDPTHTLITVEEKFVSPAKPASTNYAQMMSPKEEDTSQSDNIQQRLALLNRPSVSVSELNHDAFDDYDPWVHRDLTQQRAQMNQLKWPLTRAEVTLHPGYGEYIEILRSEYPGDDCLSTQGNNSGSLLQLEESASQEVINESTQTGEKEEKKEAMRVNMNNKPGQEHSDDEEPPTSVPATASGENTVVIATGQYRGARNDELSRNEFPKGKREKSSNGKRRKRQPDIKKSRREHVDIDSTESHDTLHCTCGDCSYRPYVRETQLCHCTDCVPQPTDDLYNIIERRCLRAEICKELNKKGVSNWKDLCIYIRIDKDITSIEQEENPADIVLDKLKTSRPRLNLEDFNIILTRIKRQDIMEIIMRHHVKCMLCRRNSFDGSLTDINQASHPNTWVASELSS